MRVYISVDMEGVSGVPPAEPVSLRSPDVSRELRLPGARDAGIRPAKPA